MSKGDSGDKIGYGRPPKGGQFKKGQSGNPAGRPKGSKNLSTVVEETLAEKVAINENGRRSSISKLEAAVKQLVNRAAAGDPKHIQQVLLLAKWLDGNDEALQPAQAPLSDADREVIGYIYERLKRRDGGGENG